MPLTDTAIRKVRPGPGPLKLSDGGGLFLFVSTAGSKLWRMAYRYAGKQKLLSFGAYPAVTLAAARKRRDHAKELLWRRVARERSAFNKGEDCAGAAFETEPDGSSEAIVAHAREDSGSVGILGQVADQLSRLAEPQQLWLIALTEISDVERHDGAVLERSGRGARVVLESCPAASDDIASRFAGRGQARRFFRFGTRREPLIARKNIKVY